MANIVFDDSYTEDEYLRTVIADFNRRAPAYDDGQNGQMHRELIATLLDTYPPSYPVLDIACGTGLLAAHLGTGRGVTGLDLTEGMLQQARSTCPDGTFVQGRAEKLPFGDGTFGSAYVCAAIVYFTDIPAAVREVYRVLRDGGFFAYQAVTLDSYVVGVVLQQALWDVLGEERGRYVFELPHAITHDEEANMRLMHDAQFVDVRVVKETRTDRLEVSVLEDWWERVVRNNGLLKRVTLLADDEAKAVRTKWIEGMEKLRGVEDHIDDHITSWYVCGYKRTGGP